MLVETLAQYNEVEQILKIQVNKLKFYSFRKIKLIWIYFLNRTELE